MTCLACLIQLPKCLWCPYQLNFTRKTHRSHRVITSNISSPASKWSNSKVKGLHVHSILPRLLILKAMKFKKKNTKSWRSCSLFAGQNPFLMPHTVLLSLLTTPSSVRRSPSSAQTSLLSILVLWNCPHLRWRVVPTLKITPWNLTG